MAPKDNKLGSGALPVGTALADSRAWRMIFDLSFEMDGLLIAHMVKQDGRDQVRVQRVGRE